MLFKFLFPILHYVFYQLFEINFEENTHMDVSEGYNIMHYIKDLCIQNKRLRYST